MKFSIGYKLPDEWDNTVNICQDYNDSISNVYFSFSSEKSGRLPLCSEKDAEHIEKIQLQELKQIKSMKKTLTLLLNANCYGESAVSSDLQNRVLSITKKLKDEIDIDRVTTTSPFIAETIKSYFGNNISVIASVNMRIATIKAMEQLSYAFDGFYLAKECNRRFDEIKKLCGWCKAQGKYVSILANSGCLPYCAYQTFHDNLVAHEQVGNQRDISWAGLPSPCHRFLRSMQVNEGLAYFLGGTWIRPENINEYESYFNEIKIATRMHNRPRMVISAYVRGRYKGNLVDLTEPSFSRDFSNIVLDNTLIPDDFFAHVTSCSGDCSDCNYCPEIARASSVKMY